MWLRCCQSMIPTGIGRTGGVSIAVVGITGVRIAVVGITGVGIAVVGITGVSITVLV